MSSLFVEWFRSTFIKRRWTVLTPAGTLIVPAIQWLVNHFSPSVWHAPYWLYILCFLSCFLIAQIFAWVEQHQKVRELTGRPEVTLRVTEVNNTFIVRTPGVALDVTIKDITIKHPDLLISTGSDASAKPTPLEVEREWIVRFEPLQDLHKDDIAPLTYKISGAGSDMLNVLCQFNGINEIDFPIVLVFSNLGGPKRSWHSHYVLNYNKASERLCVTHVDVGEVKKGNGNLLMLPEEQRKCIKITIS